MQVIALEFEDEREAERAVDHLWNRLGITGEISIRPLPGGNWRVEVSSEKPLRASTLEKIGGRLVE